jgi:hypothetical protein
MTTPKAAILLMHRMKSAYHFDRGQDRLLNRLKLAAPLPRCAGKNLAIGPIRVQTLGAKFMATELPALTSLSMIELTSAQIASHA